MKDLTLTFYSQINQAASLNLNFTSKPFGITNSNQRLVLMSLSKRNFAKGSKSGRDSSNRKDKKKAQEKAQINEEFAGQDLDSIKGDFEMALETC